MPDKYKKIFLAFKKISKSPEEFCYFFKLAAGDHESIASTELRSEKRLLARIEEPFGFTTTFFFVNVFGICFSYGTIFLMENPASPAWPPAAVRLSCAST